MNHAELVEARAGLEPGAVFVCVTSRGNGLPVEVLRVTPVNVQFRAYGKRQGREGGERRSSLPTDAFLARFALLAEAPERKRRLRLAERRGDLDRDLAEALGPAGLEAVAVAVAPTPAPPTVVAVPAGATAATETPRTAKGDQPVPSPTPPKLTGEEAREIYLLDREGTTPTAEIARTYGIAAPGVRKIRIGQTYAWATADLRAADALAEAPAASPVSTIEAGPLVADARTDHQTHEEGTEMPERESWVERAQAAVERAQAVAEQPEIPRLDSAGRTPTLVLDLADALEVLVEYAGRPLPRFVRLDVDALRALIDRARGGESA